MWSRHAPELETDARIGGWGVFSDSHVPSSPFLGETKEGTHINKLEVITTLFSLQQFYSRTRNQDVRLVSESMVTVFVMPNLTAYFPQIIEKLREFRALCEAHFVSILIIHLPSVLNICVESTV